MYTTRYLKKEINAYQISFFCFLSAWMGSKVSSESRLLRTCISYVFFSFSAFLALILMSTDYLAFSLCSCILLKSFFASTLPALFLPRILFFFFLILFLSNSAFSAFSSASMTYLLAVSIVPNLLGFKQIVVLGICQNNSDIRE